MPRPAKIINHPGPGATNAIAPRTVTKPPITPTEILQINDPDLLRLTLARNRLIMD
jgi:hypothetical protein